jgi:PKD repeat protein
MTHTSHHTLHARATTVAFALPLIITAATWLSGCRPEPLKPTAPSTTSDPTSRTPRAVIDPRTITTSEARRQLFLNGGPSTNPLSTPLQYQWSMLKGENALVFDTPNSFQTYFRGFVKPGTYQVLLMVTNQAGKSASDTATITVLPNKPPVAKAGNDIFLDYPDTETILIGKDSYDEYDEIVKSEWRQISGTSTAIMVEKASLITNIYNLAPGKFEFELSVFDGFNEVGKDTVKVEVAKPSVVTDSTSTIISGLPIYCPMGCTVFVSDYKQFLPQNATLKKVFIRSHNTITWYEITDDPNATPSYSLESDGHLLIWVDDNMGFLNPKLDVKLKW